MNDFGFMESLESLKNASSDGPDFEFVEILAILVLFFDEGLE